MQPCVDAEACLTWGNATLNDDESLSERGSTRPPLPGSAEEEVKTELCAGVPQRMAPLRAVVTGARPVTSGAEPGRLFAGRYRVRERLGTGAHGEVWIAEDEVIKELVALKWMRASSGPMLARIRREITTLRMLRVPGVVRLLEDGVEEDRPFLVMERVVGRPFPGCAPSFPGTPPRWSWAAIEEPTLALLEVLARVHAAGVIHRDLKPDNILVSAEGRPMVLDFGISQWSEPGGQLTEVGTILGTPLYLAPEQIVGRPLDGRSDLYAVGVMLYAALTGHVPHETTEVEAMLRARLLQPVARVQEIAPEVPAVMAGVIDRLLTTRIEDRLRSATEALALLRGQPGVGRAGPALPRLGGSRPHEAVVAAARAGRSVDVVGPPGSGRTRCLEDAAEALAREGRRVAWARPARMPLGSLQAVVGPDAEQVSLRLAEMTAWVGGALRAALEGGLVLLVDDAEQVDRWSAAVIERCRTGAGTVVRAFAAAPAAPPDAGKGEVVRLEPLDEAALRPLFAGPDRLFHLREDAARALWERTEGLPARVVAEVLLWVRLGLARWNGPVLLVDRDALGHLGAGLPTAGPAASSLPWIEAEPHLGELLRWLTVAGRHLDIGQLAQVMGQPEWMVEAACEELVTRGVARRTGDRRVEPRGQVDVSWPAAQRVKAHRAVARALGSGQEGRLFHLLAADEGSEITAEAVALARRRARAGDLGAATAALAEGLRAVRQRFGAGVDAEEIPLLATWVKVAFAEGTPHALDRVLYEISRAAALGPEVARLDALVRAGIAAPGASGARALELAEGIPPFADPELERWRQRARLVVAAARSAPAILEEALVEVTAWAESSGEPLAQLCLVEGRTLLRYVEGRFEEAAALQTEAAEREPWLTGRIAATLRGASALLEAFRHREAAEQAARGRDLAARCRNPYGEGRAEWLLRAAMYRMGEAATPELDLVDAVGRVGVPQLEALVCLNEAAVAFRAGALTEAAELSGRAAAVWREMLRPWGALLARCLALACGAAPDPGEVEELTERAIGCRVPGIGVQALGLLGKAFPEARVGQRVRVGRLVEGISRARWGERMDVLSVEEALVGALGDRAPPDPL